MAYIEWNSDDATWKFIVGCIVSLIICAFYPFLSVLKSKIIRKLAGEKKEFSFGIKLFMYLLYFIDTVLIYVIMLLIMAYNGYLQICCILGLTIGYSLTRMEQDFKSSLPKKKKKPFQRKRIL